MPPAERAPIPEPPWQAVIASARAVLHVEDGLGMSVEDAWVSWTCVTDSDRGPEIRIPVVGGERIQGHGDCFFQAVDERGVGLSDDVAVTLHRGEIVDVWLVVD